VKVSFAVAIFAFCLCAWTARAQEDIYYGGQEYAISVYFGTFADNESTLESQPWWGDASGANALAQYLNGLPQYAADNSDAGLFFAYLAKSIPNVNYFCTGPEAAPGQSAGNGNYRVDYSGSELGSVETGISEDQYYAIASPVPEPSTIVTGVLVVLLCGWQVLRDLRRKPWPA